MTTMLEALPTPCLVLDEARMMRNIARIHGRLADTGTSYRAHLKTAKSIEVARRQMLNPSGPGMVSTLREVAKLQPQVAVVAALAPHVEGPATRCPPAKRLPAPHGPQCSDFDFRHFRSPKVRCELGS